MLYVYSLSNEENAASSLRFKPAWEPSQEYAATPSHTNHTLLEVVAYTLTVKFTAVLLSVAVATCMAYMSHINPSRQRGKYDYTSNSRCQVLSCWHSNWKRDADSI